jgi:hypothetical protein
LTNSAAKCYDKVLHLTQVIKDVEFLLSALDTQRAADGQSPVFRKYMVEVPTPLVPRFARLAKDHARPFHQISPDRMRWCSAFYG